MPCKVTGTLTQSAFRFQAPVKGGKIFGNVVFTATCDDERSKPELRIDEDLSILSYFLDKDIYSRSPRVLDNAGKKQGNAVIEATGQNNPRSVSVTFNLTTSANGKQTFDIKLKCRCNRNDNWTPVSVDVSVNI
jgi:hypothetical protein